MACAQLKTAPEPGDAWRGKYPITVTAHRGFSGENPENTLASFRAAIAAGADMVELDVHLTRDNELVVIHDDTLERTTDGKGNVADKTLAELKAPRRRLQVQPPVRRRADPDPHGSAGGRPRPDPRQHRTQEGEELPLHDGGARRPDPRRRREGGDADQVLFSSFDPAAVDRIRERNPRLPIAVITQKPWATPEEAGGGKLYPAINSSFKNLNEKNIRLAHAAGLQVHAWTVNTPADMEKVIALGVDGIITNYPHRLIKVLQTRIK